MSTSVYWDGLYATAQDGWDLGAVTPALGDWLDSASGGFSSLGSITCWGPDMAPALPQSADGRLRARVAVPGAGRGHDARVLARHGYGVIAFDFADVAVAEARRLAASEGVGLVVEHRDVFTLGQDHAAAFDGVWEYTLLACFFPLREGEDGPPFPVSSGDIDRALAGRFTVLREGPPGRSADRRRDPEWLVEARRI